MSRTLVHSFSISLDGFGTGEDLTAEAPFGHAGDRLHEWMFATRFWHALCSSTVIRRLGRGSTTPSPSVTGLGIGAEIMGRRRFGPPGWTGRPDWRGGGARTRPSIRRRSS